MTDRAKALATVDQWFLLCEGFDLWVREAGVGEPVVVVHGGPGVEHSELVAPLKTLEPDHRVIWYDQRGSLRSPYGSPEQLESIDFDRHVDDLLRLAQETGPAHVVAHSMGTLITMAALRKRPGSFRKVVLVGAIPSTGFTESPEGRAWMAARDRQAADLITELDLDREDLSAKESQLRWRIIFAHGNAVSDDAWLRIGWPGRAWYRTEVAERSMRNCPQDFDYSTDLAEHLHKVTVVIGDTDYVDFRATNWRAISGRHPRINLRVLTDCGHNPWYDQPDAFQRAVRRALKPG